MSRSILQLLTVLAAVLFSFSADALLLEQLSVVPSQAEQPRTAGERKFAEGRELLGQNKLREAAAAFEESARADPRSYLPLLGLAEVANRERHSEDAEKYLRRAEGIAPQSAEVQTAIGQFYYGRKDYAKSEAALKKATGMEPKLIWPWLALGELYNGSQRWPAAVDAFRNVLKIDPNHAGGHFGLGRALSHSGKLDEALAEFDTAARLAPNNPLPLLAKAQLLFAQKQYDKSLAAYDQALDMHVDDVAVRMGRGEVLMAQGQGDRAVVEFKLAVKAAPKASLPLVKLGIAYQELKRWDEAEAAYRAAIKNDVQAVHAYNNLAWLLAERKIKLDEALKLAQNATLLTPKDPNVFDTLAAVHRARGDANEERKAQAQAKQLGKRG